MNPHTTRRAYTRKEMCRMYRVTYKTFAKWIEPFSGEINTTGNRIFTIREVNYIFSRLGSPFEKKEMA